MNQSSYQIPKRTGGLYRGDNEATNSQTRNKKCKQMGNNVLISIIWNEMNSNARQNPSFDQENVIFYIIDDAWSFLVYASWFQLDVFVILLCKKNNKQNSCSLMRYLCKRSWWITHAPNTTQCSFYIKKIKRYHTLMIKPRQLIYHTISSRV